MSLLFLFILLLFIFHFAPKFAIARLGAKYFLSVKQVEANEQGRCSK